MIFGESDNGNQVFEKNEIKLNINESIEIKIHSKEYWNNTELTIQSGEKYFFDASGIWTDSYINTDADGFSKWYMAAFNMLKRSPTDKWFALMGSLNKKNCFLIGMQKSIEFYENGILHCFANDVKGFYGNNKGFISLKITRIK